MLVLGLLKRGCLAVAGIIEQTLAEAELAETLLEADVWGKREEKEQLHPPPGFLSSCQGVLLAEHNRNLVGKEAWGK